MIQIRMKMKMKMKMKNIFSLVNQLIDIVMTINILFYQAMQLKELFPMNPILFQVSQKKCSLLKMIVFISRNNNKKIIN